MNLRPIAIVLLSVALCYGPAGCQEHERPYGTEGQVVLQSSRRQIWAVAPAINLSGYRQVDPLLQADLVYQQLQTIKGLTVIPVNRTAEVYLSLQIDKVLSEEQAALVCDLLGCDGLLVPTITAYDPYVPPKFGASLQLFGKPENWVRPASIDPRELARQATPSEIESSSLQGRIIQSVGMFDAANGSVRQAVLTYAEGRNDPAGPLGPKEYLVSMDRYCGFVYHQLITEVITKALRKRS